MGEEEKAEEKPEEKEKFTLHFPNENNLAIIAVIAGVIVSILPVLPAFVKGIGAILVILWGADSVRKTARYGLGTGVPSIGVLAMGYGIVGGVTGIVIGSVPALGGGGIVEPGVLVGVAAVGVVGYISGILANNEKFIGMKIPGLERGMAELGMAGALAVIIESSMIAGTWDAAVVIPEIIENGLIALIFILAGFGMFQPYNSCLGADERRGRTLLVSVEIGGLNCIILGVLASLIQGMAQGVPLIALGAITWVLFYSAYVRACLNEAHSVVGTGLIKTMR